MRPPEFTGGNLRLGHRHSAVIDASMRPPEFTGGNQTGGRRCKVAPFALQ